jgi:hypothetical protein
VTTNEDAGFFPVDLGALITGGAMRQPGAPLANVIRLSEGIQLWVGVRRTAVFGRGAVRIPESPAMSAPQLAGLGHVDDEHTARFGCRSYHRVTT